jgi:hypothetical protein
MSNVEPLTQEEAEFIKDHLDVPICKDVRKRSIMLTLRKQELKEAVDEFRQLRKQEESRQ